ncbi:Phosphoglycerate kinase [Candidatus Clavichlamydia salmonicola]|nr:Phosphoglycerate kinase [Candidatus Clavichlamydia salmonicola]
MKLSIHEGDFKNKRVLMRVDFNVPIQDSVILDDTRIRASLPSILHILDQGGSLILMSHLGRPKGNGPESSFSLQPIRKILEELLGRPVLWAIDCIGDEVTKQVAALSSGQVLLLENLRFYAGEEKPETDPSFAKALAALGDLYVNDAFGTAHRKHASTYFVPQLFPGKSFAGFLMMKEVEFLGNALSQPKRPFYSVVGGAKIQSKIGVVKSLLDKANGLILGGGMAYPFLKVQGFNIGKSLCDIATLPLAEEILREAERKKVELVLPVDAIVATDIEATSTQVISFSRGIPNELEAFDIGPESLALFSKTLAKAATVFWNGTVGVYEKAPFAHGSLSLAKIISELSAISVVGGGDAGAVVAIAGLSDKITHLSTGGGASLEYIELGTLPGLEVLSDRN